MFTKKRITLGISITLFLGIIFWIFYCAYPVYHAKPLQVGEIQIYDRNDFLIADLPLEDGFFLEISGDEKIPENFQKFLILSEDKRFFDHWGVDFLAKTRALKNNIFSGKIVSGGSTITEQWIKNEFFRGESRTITQKLREATLSLYFSGKFSKEEILRKYLNSLYFGNQVYGLKTASKVYFGKSNLDSLTKDEIEILLNILQNPAKAKNKYKFSGFSQVNRFPHFTQEILGGIEKKLEKRAQDFVPLRDKNIFKTSLDATLQDFVRDTMQHQLALLRDKNVTNSAVLVLDSYTKEILVYQGSQDFFSKEIDGQVNVIQQKRQMGSALKPFLYFLAFQDGATPENYILDIEKDFYKNTKNSGEIYHPLNYNVDEWGVVKLKHSLSNSLNISAVKILHHLGEENFLGFLKSLGIHFDFDASHYGLSLALGSPDITMWEVANAYINMMKNLCGRDVACNVSTREQQYLWETLSSQENRAKSFGLNSILNTTVPMMVKTGTTHNFKDNWVFAYHPDVMIAVWVGNNDSSPMKGVSGVSGAGPIFHAVAEELNKRGYFKTDVENLYSRDTVHRVSTETKKSNTFCRENFYIPEISQEEIEHVKKIQKNSDIDIRWCDEKNNTKNPEISGRMISAPTENINTCRDVACNVSTNIKNPEIVSPKNNEIFYINPETPLELQKIIFKFSGKTDWVLSRVDVRRDELQFVSTKIKQSKNPEKIFFWIPETGKFVIEISEKKSKERKFAFPTQKIYFEVRNF